MEVTYAFLWPPTPGHMNPMKFLASELERRGHRTVFFDKKDKASDQEAFRKIRVAVGEECTRLTDEWLERNAQNDFNEIVQFIRESKAEVLVADDFCFSAGKIAKETGVKCVNVSCSYPRMFVNFQTLMTCDLYLVQAPIQLVQTFSNHVGPLHRMQSHIERKFIYVTFGTINNGVEWIIDAVIKESKNFRLPVTSCKFGGQKEFLRHAAITICNAGMNTVLESLALGVPLVMIPMANDQDKIAEAVRKMGCGEVVTIDKINEPDLHEAINTVLKLRYHEAAMEFKKIIEKCGREKLAADLIEAL